MRQDSMNVSSLEVTLNGSQIEIDPIGNGTRPFDDVKVLLVKGQDGVGSPYTDTPSMDGTGDAGSSALYSRGDHVHPSDTSRQPVTLGTPITINGTEQTTVEGALGTIPTAMFKGSDYVTAGRAAGTTAGDRSTAEGSGVTSSAQYTHAEGLQTAATYKAAHAEGEDSTASGRDAHAEGRGTTASNAQAHAEGLNTTAGHTAAHAEGNTTQTGNNYQHVQGKYNVGKSTTAFEVGNGTANNARANALELDWDGNLTVAGTIKDSSGISLSDCQLMALSSAITIGGTEQTTVEGALNGLNDTKVDDDDSRLTDSRNLYNATPTSDSTVYLRRQTTGGMCAINKIVGGSVVKNQLAPAFTWTGTLNPTGTTGTVSNGVISISGTYGESGAAYRTAAEVIPVVKDHIYVIGIDITNCSNVSSVSAKADRGSTEQPEQTYTGNGRYVFVQKSSRTTSTENYAAYIVKGTANNAFAASIGNPVIIDLTQMFSNNPAIADYIYTLEQATAGSGIAKLAEWGFDLSFYHAYDAGSLQSVKLAGKYAVGKNLFDKDSVVVGLISSSNGALNPAMTAYFASDYIRVDDGSKYHMHNFGVSTTNTGAFYDVNKNFVAGISASDRYDYTFTVPSNAAYVRLTVNPAYVDIRTTQIEKGESYTSYEPYKGSIIPLSPTDLRGIYSLDASNNIISDGDEYYPDGGESVKYDVVNLGSLTYYKQNESGMPQRFEVNTALSGALKPSANTELAAIQCEKYVTVIANTSNVDMTISMTTSGYLRIYDSSKYASMTAAQFKTAMDGIYLLFKKSTPSTAQLSPYQSLESIASNGTEEYIDYGVQQSQRDMAIPPYSLAEYTVGNADNVIASGDIIDGYNNVLREKENHRDLISLLGDDESGRTTASRAYSVNEFFYKDGAVFKVTASIASGAAFTVGTNCTQTTIFAVLTALLNA